MKPYFDYNEAVKAAIKGELVARVAWNSNEMFVFGRPGDILNKDFIPKVKYLPQKFKDFLITKNKDIEFTPYLCLWTEEQEVVNGWMPLFEDMFATDWFIFETKK